MIGTLLRDADPARALDPDAASPAAQLMLADILAQPRATRAHRVIRAPRGPARRVLVGGLLAGAVATVALAAPMPWDGGGAGLGSAAYAVTRDGDGAVHVTVRWSELSDPAALQAALDRAGAHTKVFVEIDSSTGSTTTMCSPKARSYGGYAPGAVEWHSPTDANAENGIVVRPEKFPAGGTFVLVVSMAPAGSTAGSTFAPGFPQITGTLSFMAVGPVSAPDC